MNHQTIIVLDYGSQYSQLICRRVREAQVYAELISWDRAEEAINRLRPAGIILSGGPNSVYEPNAPTLKSEVVNSGVPILGICYGLQLMAYTLGGQVTPGREREYGSALVEIDQQAAQTNPLFVGLPATLQVWMSHGDRVEQIAMSDSIRNAQQHGLDDLRLSEDDLEVIETEHQSACATVLMLDISHSMILYGEDRITPAKKVAMALAELIARRYPKDTLDIVVFGIVKMHPGS